MLLIEITKNRTAISFLNIYNFLYYIIDMTVGNFFGKHHQRLDIGIAFTQKLPYFFSISVDRKVKFYPL